MGFVLLACITSSLCDSGTLYKRTLYNTFQQTHSSLTQTRSSLNCAHQCLYYTNLDGNCNAYSYAGDNCTLANVEFLEDPENALDEQEIFINWSTFISK